MLADLLFRLRALFRRQVVERELDDELHLHLDHEIEKYVKAGVAPAEAARRARLAFGGLDQVKEECRDARGVTVIDMTWQDLRYALRTIRRSPLFAVAAILSLTLGIGANTAIFTLIDAVMLRPLPVRAPNDLVAVGDPSRPTALREGAPMLEVLSYPLYRRLRDENHVFTAFLASGKGGVVQLSEAGGPENVRARFVSGNYFDVLGVSAAVGRTLLESDDGSGANPVVMISHSFWKKRYGADPSVVGRSVRLNRKPVTIVGVGPQTFSGEVVGSPTEMWIPLSMQPLVQGQSRLERPESNWLLGLGRLAPGVSVERARTELTLIAQQALADFQRPPLAAASLNDIRRRQLPVEPGGRGFSWVRKNVSAALFILMAVVGLVLLIACANVANLMLARATARRKEIAIRLAIGAGRGRLVRQLITEGALLAILGGAAGLIVAIWSTGFLSQLLSRGGPNPIPFDVDPRPSSMVLAFTAALCGLTTMLFALVPAARSARLELSPALKYGARASEGRGRLLGQLFVVAQIALLVPLLMAGGLFARNLVELEAVDVGYARDNLIVVKTDVASSEHASIGDRLAMVNRLLEHLRSVPSVSGVTVSENGLFSGTDSATQGLQIEGFHPSRREDTSASFDQVGPHYFRVLGIPLIAGREFDERDVEHAPLVAVVNEAMAAFYFGERSALGKVIQNGADRYTIVGIVKDNKQRTLKETTERRFYLPLLQSTDAVAAVNVVVRTDLDATAMSPTIRRELQRFDVSSIVPTVASVGVLVRESLSGDRSLAYLCGTFAVVALVLAAAGLYGVMAYTTARRTSEIGLRMALGASRTTVIRLVLRDALFLIAAGFGIGLPTAFMSLPLLNATVVNIGRPDPAVLGGVVSILLFVGVVAAGIPALRASKVDPVAALRQE